MADCTHEFQQMTVDELRNMVVVPPVASGQWWWRWWSWHTWRWWCRRLWSGRITDREPILHVRGRGRCSKCGSYQDAKAKWR